MTEVFLHGYDVTNEQIKKISREELGIDNIFHSAVQIRGDEDKEWSFGFCEQGTGVFSCPSQKNPMYTYRESILLGTTNFSTFRVKQVLREISRKWQGHSYDLLTKNCNHFCDELCERLQVPKLPGGYDGYRQGQLQAQRANAGNLSQLRHFSFKSAAVVNGEENIELPPPVPKPKQWRDKVRDPSNYPLRHSRSKLQFFCMIGKKALKENAYPTLDDYPLHYLKFLKGDIVTNTKEREFKKLPKEPYAEEEYKAKEIEIQNLPEIEKAFPDKLNVDNIKLRSHQWLKRDRYGYDDAVTKSKCMITLHSDNRPFLQAGFKDIKKKQKVHHKTIEDKAGVPMSLVVQRDRETNDPYVTAANFYLGRATYKVGSGYELIDCSKERIRPQLVTEAYWDNVDEEWKSKPFNEADGFYVR